LKRAAGPTVEKLDILPGPKYPVPKEWPMAGSRYAMALARCPSLLEASLGTPCLADIHVMKQSKLIPFDWSGL